MDDVPQKRAAAVRKGKTSTDTSPALLGAFGVAFGAISIIVSLFISGYIGIGAGIVGLTLSLTARAGAGSKPTPLASIGMVMSILGLVLGLSAQLMMAYLVRR
jgi:hypothetical protein